MIAHPLTLECSKEGCYGGGIDPTWLYTMWSEGEDFLYAGIAYDLERRLRQHQATKRWFRDVWHVSAAQHCCRWHAEHAEGRVIAAEMPIYNIVRPSYDEVVGSCWSLIAIAEMFRVNGRLVSG